MNGSCPLLALVASFNDATNGTCSQSIDEVKDRGSPNRESQYPSQGLVVTLRASSLRLPSLQVTGCDLAGFTFARSARARGDQKVSG